MFEKEIKNILIAGLNELNDYAVKDFPVNVTTYSPSHVNGEILVKALGYTNIQYLDNNNRIQAMKPGEFRIYEYRFRIELVLNNIREQDKILDMSETVLLKIESLKPEIDNYNCEPGRFMNTGASEPIYEERKGFQFRTLTFVLPIIIYKPNEQ